MYPSVANKKYIPNNKKSLPKVYARNLFQSRRVHLFIHHISLRGSYTLEAAVILPLVAAFWIFALFFIRVIQVESQVQQALYEASQRTAAEAAAVEDDKALLLSAEVLFRKAASGYQEIGCFVAGGQAGISLLSSDLQGDFVRLRAEYRVSYPIGFFKVKGISIVQNACARKWTGAEPEGGDGKDDFVYYTDYGTVYHRSLSCSYLKLSIHTSTVQLISLLRNKDGHIYYPCSGCKADRCSTGTVYYTDYGTNYHISLSCGGLKRTIHTIRESEAKGMGFCSKCGG